MRLLFRRAESAARGYLLTGDQSFMAEYHQSLDQISPAFVELKQAVRDNPVQLRLLAASEPLVTGRFAATSEMVLLREAGDAAGMAALTAALLSTLRAGDHLLAGDCLYGGTHDFLTSHAEELGWRYSFVDTCRPETWAAARTPQTKAFLVETITNPLVRVGLLDEIAAFGRREGLVTIIDNTFATPVNFRPLAAGFDLCFHSATKYLNGHSDLTAGAVMGSEELIGRVRRTLNHYGGSLDPHAGFLLARGIKTLAVRVGAHNENAMALATVLAEHPGVADVHYPGLASHPDHAQASRLLSGFGGMLSLRPRGGEAAAQALLDGVRLAYPAVSLGGVETLITRPAVTTHAGMRPEDRERLGITADLVRVSCGIEGQQDLIADFRQALANMP